VAKWDPEKTGEGKCGIRTHKRGVGGESRFENQRTVGELRREDPTPLARRQKHRDGAKQREDPTRLEGNRKPLVTLQGAKKRVSRRERRFECTRRKPMQEKPGVQLLHPLFKKRKTGIRWRGKKKTLASRGMGRRSKEGAKVTSQCSKKRKPERRPQPGDEGGKEE